MYKIIRDELQNNKIIQIDEDTKLQAGMSPTM